ncbi:MAG TPA: carboxypeptidase-like regulatory domain-containing protein, partial [Bryobacteraceae bacterium]|nr:carboxypeptidase-like regulatory domain-containing protein [Bryobacteraceae bacterium]
MQTLRPICILLLVALLGATFAFSQAVNGSLLGTVTDASGAVVPNARVTITERDTGVSRGATTNESGNYTFADVPPGTYT